MQFSQYQQQAVPYEKCSPGDSLSFVIYHFPNLNGVVRFPLQDSFFHNTYRLHFNGTPDEDVNKTYTTTNRRGQVKEINFPDETLHEYTHKLVGINASHISSSQRFLCTMIEVPQDNSTVTSGYAKDSTEECYDIQGNLVAKW